jgi:glycopeptide antibiotics resistance protein
VPRHPLSPGAVRDVLLNIAIFLPAGAWLAGGRRQLRGPARAALALVLGAGFSVLLESLQYLLGWRHSSLMDVGANATGVLLGAMLAVALAGRPSRDVRPTAVSPRR